MGTNHTSWDNVMLDEIASQLVGETFIGTISDGKNGYQKIDRFYAMSSPPSGFKVRSAEANSFSV